MPAPGDHYRRLSDISEYLVDPHVGIVTYLAEQPREFGLPEFFHYAAQACRTEAFAPHRNFRAAGGAAIDRSRAVARSIGEAVERYCGAIYDPRDLPVVSANEAKFRCADPELFALYGRSQYDDPSFIFVPFDRDTPVAWTPAVAASTGETVHVPAAMVHVPYVYYRGSGDQPILQPVSTGLACHVSYPEAVISAACEVIERDAFSITWQAMLAPPHIDPDTLPLENREILRRFAVAGGDVTLFDLSFANVATVLAVLRHPAEKRPPLTFAASTDLDPAIAVRDALEELAHTHRYVQNILELMPRLDADPTLSNVVDQESHLNYWCDRANAEGADFLFESGERHSFEELPNASTGGRDSDLKELVNRVAASGHELLVANVTTSDVAELGLHVVRALIPGFHPLFWNHRYRALGGRRLRTLPQAMNYAGIPPGADDNPRPHPYP